VADDGPEPPPAEEQAVEGAVDPSVLQSLTSRLGDRGPAMLDTLLETWETETDRRLGELRTAVDAGDAEAVSRVVHAMRGGSASLGATRLAAVCGDVETRIRLAEEVELPQAQARILAAVAEARRGLRQLRVGSAG
jgi:HPt (histidine-containing phosphotransfer) domain-containing protein